MIECERVSKREQENGYIYIYIYHICFSCSFRDSLSYLREGERENGGGEREGECVYVKERERYISFVRSRERKW